jgi:putative FmdB family regulatory protein
MPMYEYECTACGHRFERIRKFSDPPVDECPNCGAPKVQKLLSSPAFQFKGTGWYITDYAKKTDTSTDAKSEASADGSKNKDTKGSSESKESKEPKEPKEPKGSKGSKESKESKNTSPTSGTTRTAKASGE